MKSKPQKRGRKKHFHKWKDPIVNCPYCGSYEAYCHGCQKTGVFDKSGKLIVAQ